MLKKHSVPDTSHSDYVKWLRYYLDYCSKFSLSAEASKNVPLFIRKLREKKQPDLLQKQACHAVSIYLDMVRANAKSQQPADGADPRGGSEEDISGPLTFRRYSIPGAAKAQWQKAIVKMATVIKTKHYSAKTLRAYSHWVRKFQSYKKDIAPALLEMEDVKAFLSWLAVSCRVSTSSQDQAFNAILFFFRHVLKKDFGEIRDVVRTKRRPNIPEVLSRDEVARVICCLYPPYDLIVKILYGCGLRLFECIKLKVQNFDFDSGALTVQDGKGRKERTVPLPQLIIPDLLAQVERLKELHDKDLAAGYAGVFLAPQLEKKYKNAAREFIWQWFFPQRTLTNVEDSNEKRRYHVHESHVRKAIRTAVRRAKLSKRVTSHTFRDSFATHLLQANYDIRTIQKLLGHSDVRTTMIYTRCIPSRIINDAISPLDF